MDSITGPLALAIISTKGNGRVIVRLSANIGIQASIQKTRPRRT